jgi:hypothetical protein
MNISSPPPQEHQGYMPPRHDSGVSWHQEFAQQQSQAPRHIQNPAQGMGLGSGYGYYPQASGINMTRQQFGGLHSQSQSLASQQAQSDAFDDAAFARAFEEAAQHEAAQLKAVEAAGTTEEALHQEGFQNGLTHSIAEASLREQLSQPTDNLMEAESNNLNLPRIGADTIRPQETEPTPQQQQEAPDALARTAGSLLESVQHDQSDKFKGSQFLELMRMLRDKEVAVRGDDIVGTGSADLEGDAERAVGEVKGARPSDYLDMWETGPVPS